MIIYIITTAEIPILMIRSIISPANPILLNIRGKSNLNTAIMAKIITSQIKRFSNHAKSKHMINSYCTLNLRLKERGGC
jgi:hypothetical protein